jgi:hypothetical protein
MQPSEQWATRGIVKRFIGFLLCCAGLSGFRFRWNQRNAGSLVVNSQILPIEQVGDKKSSLLAARSTEAKAPELFSRLAQWMAQWMKRELKA